MPDRRSFMRTAAAGATGTLILARESIGAAGLTAQVGAPRREVMIGGRRVRVIDVHAHCVIPVLDVVRGTSLEEHGGGSGTQVVGPARIKQMDEAGIDMQALTINRYWWYLADRELAARIVRAQNEGLAKIVSTHPDRFVAFGTVALQFPDLAVQQLEDAITRLGLRGVSIGGHVNGEDVSLSKYDPFWAKLSELGVTAFMHPHGAANIVKEDVLDGRGDLGNIIGNPLETTYFLSRLIFDGTFDRHPNLRIIAPHGGGYLPSYLGRTDVACKVRNDANCANRRNPREYLERQIVADSMVFTDQALRHLVNEAGVEQVVYGTDMPFNWPNTLEVILNASYLTDSEKEAILGGNAMKLLRISHRGA